MKVAEKNLKHHWDFWLEKPPINPAAKTIYDGSPKLDEEIIDSRSNLKDTEKLLSHKFTLDDYVQLNEQREPLATWAPTPKKADHPTNYFVPNFGLDHDMIETKSSAQKAEKGLGHNWIIPEKPAKPHPMNYFVPNFGQDEDIKSSISNLNKAEGKLGKWNFSG